MLTGKARHDFETWYCIGHDRIGSHLQLDVFYGKPNIEKQAYWIEWFESVEIYINITTVHPIKTYGWSYNLVVKDDIRVDYSIFKTKIEALFIMLDKANLIYNSEL